MFAFLCDLCGLYFASFALKSFSFAQAENRKERNRGREERKEENSVR